MRHAFVITVVSGDAGAGAAIHAAIKAAADISAHVRAFTPREVEEMQRTLRCIYDDIGYRSILESVRKTD